MLSTIWSYVWSIVEGLLITATGALGVILGVGALRDIGTGKTRSLNRTSTRVIYRAEEPTAFWATIATGLLWGCIGAFLLAIPVMMLLGV